MIAHRDELARRYRRLLGFYPADYRSQRGDEIVETYLELAGAGRRWPSPADAADLFRGGLRQRLRANRALGLLAGLPIAAMLALTTATTLAAVWLLWAEIAPTTQGFLLDPLGPFGSLGALVWLGWLAAGVAAVVLPARIARRALFAALLLTVAVIPASALTPYARPPLFVLLPQFALGALSLALPPRQRWSTRLAPVFAPLIGAVLAIGVLESRAPGSYRWYADEVLAEPPSFFSSRRSSSRPGSRSGPTAAVSGHCSCCSRRSGCCPWDRLRLRCRMSARPRRSG
ncbi:hypothetical protein [Micromonospora sp. NPDC049679]|uniref:hypothetical protein n=1 Tax=Micromonospora sp. NPDC049679 TaxID=3155920 RepID=UPI0033F81327